MANFDSQKRLCVPKCLMDLSCKACFVFYDFVKRELYISQRENKEDCLIDKVKFDSKNRFCLSKEMRSNFSVENDTQIIFYVKNGNLYLRKAPLSF